MTLSKLSQCGLTILSRGPTIRVKMTPKLTILVIAISLLPSPAQCGPKIKTKRVTPDEVARLTANKPVELLLLDNATAEGTVRAADSSSLVLVSASGLIVEVPMDEIQEIRLDRKTACRNGIAGAFATISSVLTTVGGVAAMNDRVAGNGFLVSIPVYFGVCAIARGKPYYSKVLRLAPGRPQGTK